MTEKISRRFWRVWQRNLVVYRQTWRINFIPPILEPLFYLLAFGVGLNQLVGNIDYRGARVSYIEFLVPALIAVNMMNNAFYENTYASYVRMYYQKTFDAMMATPLTVQEIITGEIVWGATKSVIATVIMMAVIGLFGYISFPESLLIIPLACIGGMVFGSLGMYFTAVVPSIELFNIPVFLFVTPMFLFSGTFFPMDSLPGWAQSLALALPLTHLVNITRSITLGNLDRDAVWGVLYLLGFFAVCFPLALSGMHKRLIR